MSLLLVPILILHSYRQSNPKGSITTRCNSTKAAIAAFCNLTAVVRGLLKERPMPTMGYLKFVPVILPSQS